jgi:hypothetical protein
MLPILRVIPVGGVLLAIAILLLALNPPGDPRAYVTGPGGALIAREQHPEWPQLLLFAAFRRAGELSRLRELPDTPIPLPPEAPLKTAKPPEVAAVPNNPTDAQPEDVTGSIVQSPKASIPLDIGETSSVELPVIPHEERPPVITPSRAKRQHEGHAAPDQPTPQPARTRRTTHGARPVAKQQDALQFGLFESLFGGGKGLAAANQSTVTTSQPPFTAQ